MAEAEAANARMEGRMEAKLLAAQEANKGKLVKLEGMPVMPQPLSGETMLTPVQLWLPPPRLPSPPQCQCLQRTNDELVTVN